MGVKWKLTDRPFTTTTPGRSIPWRVKNSEHAGRVRTSWVTANARGQQMIQGSEERLVSTAG